MSTPNLLTELPRLILSQDFYKGLVLGIQDDDEIDDSNCQQSILAMLTLTTTADIDFANFAAATTEKG